MSPLKLARIGGWVGLALGGAFAGRLIQLHGWWGVVVGVAYVAPFGAALLAPWVDGLRARSWVWLYAGLGALLLAFTSPSGVTLVLLPSAALLLAAGGSTFRAARRGGSRQGATP